LMTELGSKYEEKNALLKRDPLLSVAGAFGVTVTAFVSGGTSAAWGAIISAVITDGMSDTQKRSAAAAIGGSSLIDAYESAIVNKKNALISLDGYISQYNTTYLAYSRILKSHDLWDTHEGASSQPEIHVEIPWISNWEYDSSLPSFTCGGSCNLSFNTPTGDHWVKCGYRRSILKHPEYIRRRLEDPRTYPASIITDLLKDRPAEEGCGRHYYNCEDEDEHKLRTCQRPRTRWEGNYIVTKACLDKYRKCMGKKRDHDPSDNYWFKTIHSDEADSNEATASTPSTPSTPTTPTYHACSVHETTVSGNHSSTTPPCGVSSHATYACQIGSNHKNAVTCPTDSNGQACIYGSYYPCSPHTHAYPSVDNTPDCSSCTDGCSSCPVTCAVGHVYDPSKANLVSEHKTRTCRFCSQTWQKCVTSTAPKCREPKRKKQNRHCWAAED